MARCIYWKLDWLWVIFTKWCWPLQCRLFATPWETGIWHVYSCICGGNKGNIKVSVKNPILLIYADVNAEINYSRLQDYHQQMEIKWSIGLACDMHIHHHRIGHLFNGNSRKIHVLPKAMCFVPYITLLGAWHMNFRRQFWRIFYMHRGRIHDCIIAYGKCFLALDFKRCLYACM